MAFFWSFALILAVYGLDSVSAQCNMTCPLLHPQTIKCTSDFVIRAKPISSTVLNGNTTVYTVKYFENISGSKTAKTALKARKLYTALNASTCGVELKVGTTYVLSGKLVDGLPTLDYCGINQPYVEANSFILKELNEDNKEICACTIDTCVSGTCTKTPTNCIYDRQYLNGPACYAKYGLCKKDEKKPKNCNWSTKTKGKNNMLTKCLSTTSFVPLV